MPYSSSEDRRQSRRRYRETPRGRYTKHKVNARRRGVEFLLTFEEWWGVWAKSRRWKKRGNRRGQYNMMRYNDEGPYAAGNVHIGRHEGNVAERNRTVVRKRHTRKTTEVIWIEHSTFNAEEAPF